MGPKVLALIENSIGVRLTLAARLTDLGCQLTIVTAPEAFAERIHGEAFDWIFLDDAAVPPHRRRFFAHLAENLRSARVVWCGEWPRETPFRMETVFAKPLRYDEIERFFSQRMSDGRVASTTREAPLREPPGNSKGPPLRAEVPRKNPAEAVGPDDATDAGGHEQP